MYFDIFEYFFDVVGKIQYIKQSVIKIKRN